MTLNACSPCHSYNTPTPSGLRLNALTISAFTSLAKTTRFSFAQSVEHGHRVYTVAMHEMKTLRGMLDTLAADATISIERTPARSVEVILEKFKEIVNLDAVSKVVDDNGET